MNIAIVEDSVGDAQCLKDRIERYCNLNHLEFRVQAYSSGENFLLEFEAGKFQVIFLDIFLSKLDGIQVAREIRAADEDCLLIFVTTSQFHAVESFRVRAFDYLVKPYEYEQLEEVLRLCEFAVNNKVHYIEVKHGRIMIKIPLREIIYTDYYNHYIQIHTKKRVIKCHLSFSDFSVLLLCYPQFLCCYRNCIVNMDEIWELDEKDFVMKNGERVPLSRAQCKELRQRYADYVFTKMEGGN